MIPWTAPLEDIDILSPAAPLEEDIDILPSTVRILSNGPSAAPLPELWSIKPLNKEVFDNSSDFFYYTRIVTDTIFEEAIRMPTMPALEPEPNPPPVMQPALEPRPNIFEL